MLNMSPRQQTYNENLIVNENIVHGALSSYFIMVEFHSSLVWEKFVYI